MSPEPEPDPEPEPEPEPDTHEYVDLGLPSGLLWATNNIQDEDGNELYFAWGETQGYTSGQVGTEKNFSWSDYEFGNPYSGTLVTDSLIDENNDLKPEYDASVVNWGNGWRMPTKEDFIELSANTTTAWTVSDNGISGATFTSTNNGNTLFFPAVGGADGGKVSEVGSGGSYRSSSLSSSVNYAWWLYFGNGYCDINGTYRCVGFSVRPVRKSQ